MGINPVCVVIQFSGIGLVEGFDLYVAEGPIRQPEAGSFHWLLSTVFLLLMKGL